MSNVFKINKVIPPFTPEVKEKRIFDIIDDMNSNVQELNCPHSIYISDKARENILNHIEWNNDTKNNSVEQGGLLIGTSYRDYDESIYGIVRCAIPATTAEGSKAYLKFSHRTWKMMMDKFDTLNEISEGDLQIIGWYHTHPRNLSVFMSGTDLNTQSNMFSMDWQFSVVLNPQKKIWRVYCGEKAEECKGYMFK